MIISLEDEKLVINSDNIILDDVLGKIEKGIGRLSLEKKDSLHLRLLAEETLGMLKTLTGSYMAYLWLQREDDIAELHLVAKTEGIDYDTKQELISVASSGKNAYAKGFMGRIGDLFKNMVMYGENTMKLADIYSAGYVDTTLTGTYPPVTWSLSQYRVDMETMNDREEAGLMQDILEKSIVASIAKDVTVGVRDDKVEMVISMSISQ